MAFGIDGGRAAVNPETTGQFVGREATVVPHDEVIDFAGPSVALSCERFELEPWRGRMRVAAAVFAPSSPVRPV